MQHLGSYECENSLVGHAHGTCRDVKGVSIPLRDDGSDRRDDLRIVLSVVLESLEHRLPLASFSRMIPRDNGPVETKRRRVGHAEKGSGMELEVAERK